MNSGFRSLPGLYLSKIMGDLKFQPVVESEDLLALASRIRNDLPHGLSLHNTLLMNARGYNNCFQYEFFVLANHPDSHIVVWLREHSKLGIHCREEETTLLVKAIEEAQLLPYQVKRVQLFHLSDYLLNPLYEIVKSHHQDKMNKGPHHTFAYLASQDYPLRCPAGMRLHRLGKAGVQHLLQMSSYNKNDNVEHMCTFAANVPALGIYLDSTISEETVLDLDNIDVADPDDTPVAWVSSYPYGSLGMLMTSEEYRGQGLASLLMEAIARLQVTDGYIPHAHIDLDNTQSAALFRKLPGWTNICTATWLCYSQQKK